MAKRHIGIEVLAIPYPPMEIAKRAPQIRVVGIDASKGLVRIGQINGEREGLSDRVRFVKCDGTKLPLKTSHRTW